MEILEIVSGAQVNGAVVHCALLCTELKRRGHGVTVVCRQDAKIQGLLADSGIRMVESDLHKMPFDEVRRISAIAKEIGSEVIHTHMTRAHNFGVVLRRFCDVPCVATAHSHIIQPLTWMFNDRVIAVSEATRRFQLKWNLVRAKNIDTVYGFTDYSRQASVPPTAGTAIRSELNLPDSAPVFGIIGDIIPRKGHLYVVRALPAILAEVPDARMIVVGDPKRKMGHEYFTMLQAEALRLGVSDIISWLGYRTDVPNIMRALDAYVLASLDEMFPVAVLEAMAARRPIVATNVGGVPECLTDDVTGVVVPSADPGALGRAIVRLLKNRCYAQELANRARDRVRDEFSVQSQAPRIEAVFERAIERFRPAGSPRGVTGSAP